MKVPAAYKINKHVNKVLLVETFKDLLDESISHAPKKGFHLPLNTWLERYVHSNVCTSFHELSKEFQLLHSTNPFAQGYSIPKSSTGTYKWTILLNWIKNNREYLASSQQIY
jgi:transcriptional antiterminator